MSHHIVDWSTGAFLVNVIAGNPPTDTLLLPVCICNVPKVKFPISIKLPPKLSGSIKISSLVKFSIGSTVNLKFKVVLPVGFCKVGRYLYPPAYTGFNPSKYFWSPNNWLSSKDISTSFLALKIFCKSKIFSFFLVNSITLDLPSIKYLIYTFDLSGNADPVSTISEK